VNGGVSLGLDYKRANDIGNLNFDSDFTYRSRFYETSIKLNTVFSFQKDRQPTRKADLNGSVINFLSSRWFIGGILGLSQNTELGLNLRLFTTGAYGRLLISTNHNRLITAAGLSVNREWTTSNTENSYNLEALLSAVFSIFVYNTPKTDFTTSVNAFPNLTARGRVRIDFESKLKQEIIKDFTVNFSIYLNYDSKPPSSSVTKADYGITFGLGYTL
jgi:hypothetical protein